MQEFWIDTGFITENIPEVIMPGQTAIKIYIPNSCPKCAHDIKISYPGSITDSGTLIANCLHTYTYNDLWNIRIQASHDPLNDGCKCEKCTEWTPMAQPNLPNNKFKCYRCRTHPLSF